MQESKTPAQYPRQSSSPVFQAHGHKYIAPSQERLARYCPMHERVQYADKGAEARRARREYNKETARFEKMIKIFLRGVIFLHLLIDRKVPGRCRYLIYFFRSSLAKNKKTLIVTPVSEEANGTRSLRLPPSPLIKSKHCAQPILSRFPKIIERRRYAFCAFRNQ